MANSTGRTPGADPRALEKRPLFERRMMVVLLLEAFEPLSPAADISLLERIDPSIKNVGVCRRLAIAITGPLVERYPALPGSRPLGDGRRLLVRRPPCWRCSGLCERGRGDFLRLRALRRSDARAARVLHPQVDRLGAP